MDAVTLDAVLSELGNRLEKLQFTENCNAFVAEYNRLLTEAKKVFAREAYVQTFVEVAPTRADTDPSLRDRTLEEVRMRVNLLRSYVNAEVSKERRKTSVY